MTTSASSSKSYWPSVNSIGNAAYHAALVGGLSIAYGKIGHMIVKSSPTPQLEKLNSGALTAVLYIGLGIWTKDMLISNNILPADILK